VNGARWDAIKKNKKVILELETVYLTAHTPQNRASHLGSVHHTKRKHKLS